MTSDNWFGPGGGVVNLTDLLGVTDSQRGQRSVDELNTELTNANEAYETSINGALDPYRTAAEAYDPLKNLNTYSQLVNQNMTTANNAVAGAAGNTKNWFNPMQKEMLQNATQQVLGAAGGKRQSSGTMNAVADRAALMSGQMWDAAAGHSLKNTDQAIQNAGQNMNAADTQLANQNRPQDTISQGQMDMAGTKYQGEIEAAKAKADAAGQDKSLLGSLGIF